MENRRPSFVLAGNTGAFNRGCEGIDVGTAKILAETFDDPELVYAPVTDDGDAVRAPGEYEIAGVPDWRHPRTSPLGFARGMAWVLAPRLRYRTFLPDLRLFEDALRRCDAVLALAGDNYTMDYSRPDMYWALDEMALRARKPLVLWAGTIGRFDKLAGYEEFAAGRLNKADLILTRESRTIAYLRSIGVKTQIELMADPAFVLDPAPVDSERLGFSMPQRSIGVNLSPLVGTYADHDAEIWARRAADVLTALAGLGEKLVLVPHVTWPEIWDDHRFLEHIRTISGLPLDQVLLAPRGLNAAETKWVIGNTSVFIGARTHSTIAALSSMVPTVTVAYSEKAWGISKDIYDSEDNVVDIADLEPNVAVEKVRTLLDAEDSLRTHLEDRIAKIKARAYGGGHYVKQLLEAQQK